MPNSEEFRLALLLVLGIPVSVYLVVKLATYAYLITKHRFEQDHKGEEQ